MNWDYKLCIKSCPRVNTIYKDYSTKSLIR